jgi:UPF0716 protein FxsA
MFIRLLALFTLVPLIELYVLLKVGGLIGIGPTIALILLTGIAGAYLARTQGFDLLRRIRTEMAQGRLPASELLDGAMVLAGGVLLLTPGFCTDLLGFSLLAPFTRVYIKQFARLWLQRMIESGRIDIHRF